MHVLLALCKEWPCGNDNYWSSKCTLQICKVYVFKHFNKSLFLRYEPCHLALYVIQYISIPFTPQKLWKEERLQFNHPRNIVNFWHYYLFLNRLTCIGQGVILSKINVCGTCDATCASSQFFTFVCVLWPESDFFRSYLHRFFSRKSCTITLWIWPVVCCFHN